MTTLMVPRDPFDERWPTLGAEVCAFIETFLVFGPGDLLGEPAVLDAEKRALIYRMYEVYPQGHEWAGRRRFKRAGVSLRKGTAKTELSAWLAAVELHVDGPVRCVGWDERGQPAGGGVTDPYIPMVAYTEEQSDELAYGALRKILEYSDLARDFDIGLERIMRAGGDGKAVSLASSPSARDGARTTFQVFDETHRFVLPGLRNAHRTMLANVPKRFLADAWSLEITTAPAAGQGSVAEDTLNYARMVEKGQIEDSKLFFFHRQASDGHDLSTKEGVKAAVLEASGPAHAWSDLDAIAQQWEDPTSDKLYLERVWLNRVVRASERAFEMERWRELGDQTFEIPPGETVTLGFDGSRWHDATALVVAHVLTGFLQVIGLWERPEGVEEWEVPVSEVNGIVEEAFARWNVWRLYADPPYWETTVAEWSGRYGEARIIEWWTTRPRQMAAAIRSFDTAIKDGALLHDGSPHLTRHVGNACRKLLNIRDEKGERMWVIYKERSDSPHKIDGAMSAVLAWEARNDALASGVGARRSSVYEKRGLVMV